MPYIDARLEELERGQSYPFADWPNQKVPRVAAGVYTVWQGATFLYVGISGEKVTEVSDESKAKGLFKRLNSHALGHRGGDQFCLLVCDRLILPNLTREELNGVGRGTILLDVRTRDFIIRECLSYRFVQVKYPEAKRIENKIRGGVLSVGKPLLNGK